MKEIIKFAITIFKKVKLFAILSWISTIIGMIATGLIPQQTGICITAITESIEKGTKLDFSPIWLLLLFIILTCLFSASMVYLRRIVYFTMHKMIQEDLYKKLLTLGNNFYQKNQTGYLVTLMTQDLDKISWFIYQFFFIFPELIILVSVSFFFIIKVSPLLAVILVAIISSLVPVNIRVMGKFREVYKDLQKQISFVNDEIELSFYGISVVKAYQREEDRVSKFKSIMGARAKSDYKAFRFRMIIGGLFWALPSLLTTIVIFYGGFYLMSGSWKVGDLSAIVGYMWMITVPLMFIGELIADFTWAKACFDRIRKVLTSEAEITETEKASKIVEPLTFKDKIVIKNLSFHYDTEDNIKPIFDNINITIGKRKKIGILGEVGSGKSTLLLLLLRLLNQSDGEIILDGKDIRKLNLSNYRHLFGYVPQEPILFSDTIRENIIFGRDEITDEDIIKAIRIAQFEKELDKFPNGLNELIGPNGLTLSGGQRQRLALARALVHNPEILLLDDTTSALDTKTENDLWKSIKTELKDITKIIITHRASTIADADYIYVLEDSKILEEGTPTNLLKIKSYFRELYNKQMFDTDDTSPVIVKSRENEVYSSFGVE